MSTSSDNPFLYYICMIVGGIIAYFWGFTRLKRKRLIQDIPTSTIRAMAMGMVEIIGQAIPHKTLVKAPFSGIDSVYFKYEIEEYRSSGKSSRWVSLAKGDSALNPFYVQDETGKVLTAPAGAEIFIKQSFRESTQWGKTLSTQIENSLHQWNINTKSFLGFSRTLRFTEWRIEPQQPIYVLGYVQKNPNFDNEYNLILIEKLDQLKKDPVLIKTIDTNGDGEISIEEWDMARYHIEQKIIQDFTQNGKQEQYDLVISDNKENNIFIISDKSQKELLKILNIHSILGVWGGSICAIIGLMLLLSYFHAL